ncbi:quinoprotein dehydrogenase-associated SoxYZ-like carrier [Amaricoccus sp.]|uniref:quinoprotein dehydrogenase-associated SoxYZ-like carrier n=1 Tax=Amaricoccus sp. TaxID=1872485 RepID=UPI001B7BEC0F|nr:quinoprotein dehydrogenase-associated SoxYZ-like carrier [Amaricoccus sp.]MBP7241232.1 quinoprotein dehydrogenase-associated SoxYZ-like carrier [Amaricoccus sp.]
MQRACLILAALLAAGPALGAGNTEPDRLARWDDLTALIFGEEAEIAPTEDVVTIEAPKRALDSALVPVAVAVADPTVAGVALIVDENPGPLAARVRFGPAGDPRALGLRVRIDGYTNVHAVATLADGSMVGNAVFVKGAGGCSAPIGVSDEEAMAGMGEMRMKFAQGPDGAGKATLMVRHPNFNGMQMNQISRLYTPPRFVTDIEVTRGDELVLAMESDISLATDPVIDFLYRTGSDAPFTVSVTDSKGDTWSQDFAAPELAN